MNINIDDKEIYGIVAQEMANNTIDSGLMAKALAETDFNDNRSKAMYLKMRVADLKKQQEQQQILLEKQILEAQKKQEQIKKQRGKEYKKLDEKKLHIFLTVVTVLGVTPLIIWIIISIN